MSDLERAQVASEWLAALLAEARAEAWDEGYEAGHATARAVNTEYPEEPTNPYRRAES